MDALTHKTGITPQGRLIHGDQPEPTLAERHANRLRRACATMVPLSPPVAVRTVGHADGRTAYPDVVQYQVQCWSAADRAHMPVLIDLPPTDPAETYRIVVHDLPVYDRLQQAGALEFGHRLPPVGA